MVSVSCIGSDTRTAGAAPAADIGSATHTNCCPNSDDVEWWIWRLADLCGATNLLPKCTRIHQIAYYISQICQYYPRPHRTLERGRREGSREGKGELEGKGMREGGEGMYWCPKHTQLQWPRGMIADDVVCLFLFFVGVGHCWYIYISHLYTLISLVAFYTVSQ